MPCALGDDHCICAYSDDIVICQHYRPAPAAPASPESGPIQTLEEQLQSSEARALTAETWRPIETVPRNEVVVVTDGENAAVSALEDTDYHDKGYWALDGDGGLDWEPTHWMPLPEPPRSEEGGQP